MTTSRTGADSADSSRASERGSSGAGRSSIGRCGCSRRSTSNTETTNSTRRSHSASSASRPGVFKRSGLDASYGRSERLRNRDADQDDDPAGDLQRVEFLAKGDPRGDGGDDRLKRRRKADSRGRDEPHRGQRERERDDRRDNDHRGDLDVAVHGCLRPRQEPGRMYDAPPDKREPKAPHEERRGAVRLPKAFAEREVKREDERVHRGKREAERVELAQSRVVRTGREEAPENGEHRGNPEAAADRPPAEPRVDQEQDRPGVLDDEGNPDRDALDRLVIDERYAREANDTEDNEEGQVGAPNPQVKAHRRKDRKEYEESEEDTPFREDGRLHTRVEGRLRDNAADTKERGRC